MNTTTTNFQVYYAFRLHMTDNEFNFDEKFFLPMETHQKRKIYFWFDSDQYDGS